MPVVAYLRCSDAKQDKSIAQQRAAIEARAVQDGPSVEEWFTDDGISGITVIDRPGLLALRAWAESLPKRRTGEVRAVYAWAQSRLGRSEHETMTTLAILDAASVETRFLSDPEPADVDARQLLRSIRSTIDAQHSRRLSKDVPRGMRDAAGQGRWPFGEPPYGYDVVHDIHDRAGRLVANPAQAEAVRLAYSIYEEGNGDKTTAKLLTDRGVPPPQSRTRARGLGTWYAKNIADMITAAVYAGRITFRGEVVNGAAHEPIIDPERWERLQATRRERARQNVRGNPATAGSRGLLLPFLRCGLCDGRMHVSHGTATRFHYACAVRTRQTAACEGVNARIDLLDEVVWGKVQEYVLSPATLYAAAARWREGLAMDDGGARRAALERQVNEADAAIKRAVFLFTNGLAEQGDIEGAQRLHQNARATARDQLRLLPQPVVLPPLTDKGIREFRDRVLAAMHAKPIEDRRRALQRVISAVVVRPGQVTVTYRPRLVDEPEVTTSGGPEGSW